MLEIVLMVASCLIGAALSKAESREQSKIAAHETYIRSLFEATKSRFGVAISQLQQIADKYGFNLTQLSEATRGSARLSRASALLRGYVEKYPRMIDRINQGTNSLNRLANNLSSKEDELAATIRNTNSSSANYGSDALKSINSEVADANKILTGLNAVNSEENPLTTNIDTNLVVKEQKY